MSAAPRLTMTLSQQAEFVDYIVERCVVKSQPGAGRTATETVLYLTADDVDGLRQIADRLHMMAPHSSAIRRVVTGQ